MSSTPREFSIYVEQGADLNYGIIAKFDNQVVMDLTGFMVTAKYSKSYTSPTSSSITATIVDAVKGQIKLSLTGEQTRNIKAGRYVYNVFLSNGQTTVKFCYGIMTVNPSL